MKFVCEIEKICKKSLLNYFGNFILKYNNKNFFEIVFSFNKKKYGDFQCNSALKLYKILQVDYLFLCGIVKYYFQKNIDNININFNNIKISKRGFINFTLDYFYIFNLLHNQFLYNKFFFCVFNKRLKVIIDFSSPNIAKDMHIGHLRSTIIGDCVSNVLFFLNYNVIKISHLGDWGIQFAMLISYFDYLKFDFINKKMNIFLLTYYYKNSQKKKIFDKNFKKNISLNVNKLQNYNKFCINLWKNVSFISIMSYHKIYELLKIKIIDRPESYYNFLISDLILDLMSKNLLINLKSSLFIELLDFKNKDGNNFNLILKKKDGGFTYAAVDLTTLRYRVNIEKAMKVYYVTDIGQKLHFEMIFNIAYNAGYVTKNIDLKHIYFGIILNNIGKRVKSRLGNSFKFIDLIKQSVIISKNILTSNNNNYDINCEDFLYMCKIIGINSIKYLDLSVNRLSNYEVKIDTMISNSCNNVIFIIYAYARSNKLLKNISINKYSFINIINSKEIDLCLYICQFEDIINDMLDGFLLHKLVSYIFILSVKFNVFFDECKINNSYNKYNRLILCGMFCRIIDHCFIFLGLNILDKI